MPLIVVDLSTRSVAIPSDRASVAFAAPCGCSLSSTDYPWIGMPAGIDPPRVLDFDKWTDADDHESRAVHQHATFSQSHTEESEASGVGVVPESLFCYPHARMTGFPCVEAHSYFSLLTLRPVIVVRNKVSGNRIARAFNFLISIALRTIY